RVSQRRSTTEKSDHWHRDLLPAHFDRPRDATNERNELAPPHSISSSARASSEGGTVSPSALATLRLTTSSNLVGCSMGRWAGWAPFRMLSTKVAARRKRTTMLAP